MNVCSRYPCGWNGVNCGMQNCPRSPQPFQSQPPIYNFTPIPMGCICPPTSEKTCENSICPRKNRSLATGQPQPPADRGGAAE